MGDGGGGPLAPGAVVGFVGLGRMGNPMATRLVGAGYGVRGHDIDAGARGAFAASTGGTAVESAADAADGAAAVILMLPNSAIVSDVCIESGLLDAMGRGTVLIDMSSSQPESTQRLAVEADRRGVRLIDAPVSGGVPRARDGTLTVMVGGPEDWLEECAPVLNVIGNTVIHTGPVGAGHAMKALNNLLSATHLLASAEVLMAGMRFGLDANTMVEVLNGSSGRSWSTETKLPRYIIPRTFDSGFSLQLLVKDARIAVELARSTGVTASLAEAALALWEEAGRRLPDDADHTEIARWVEEGEERTNRS